MNALDNLLQPLFSWLVELAHGIEAHATVISYIVIWYCLAKTVQTIEGHLLDIKIKLDTIAEQLPPQHIDEDSW